ncbi:uncharacterized protein B0I36DRAFT_342291 [Microdochium trichocladiopsis]|uniref:Uncharacterized protein n=1 Tax=Microdochium trichocladiopsis TaxID=1682393 RepID=A0A9P8XPM3_9PEZI|nr:uncharacterized protein B0I36DRAFT_342291 [Microdochium trichocladiopsis]KAH7009412.1 hypothetical protein B0I36DRAFT_342291 [Microdochium trichocladiopsis]
MSEILGHKRAKETFESLWIQSFRCIRLVFGFYVALANIYDTRPQDGVMLTGASAVSSQIEELARLWCRLCAWLIFLLCIDWYGKINNRKEKATATNAAEAVPEPQSFDRACPAISQTLVACETLIRASLAQLELVSSLLKEIQASGQHSTQDDGGGGGVVVGVGSEATNLIPAYATSPSAQME